MPELFVWLDEYALGLPEVDGQHRRLFELGREAERLAPAGAGDDAAARVIAAIAASVRNHFRTEEELMEAGGCACYAAHKSEHEALLALLPELTRAGITHEVLRNLDAWITRHIAGVDRQMALELKPR